MPYALIFYRTEFGAHTQNPEERGWPHGAIWVRELWDIAYWGIYGVDVWIFTNEWFSNKRDLTFLQRFTTFWKQVIDECLRRQIMCTVADLPVGTPGHPLEPAEAHQLPALQELIAYCERAGMWWNQHLYKLRDPKTDNLMVNDMDWTRYRLVKYGHPNLKIVGGEMGNINDGGGMFTAQSFNFIKAMYAAVKDDNVLGGWWLLCDPERQRNPEADWSKDNWFAIFDQYIDWVVAH